MKPLIDRLQIAQGNNNADELIPEVIEMLCQQQAEIEALEAKTLTDEEIDLIAGMVPTIPTGWDLIEFARAILRKANEK